MANTDDWTEEELNHIGEGIAISGITAAVETLIPPTRSPEASAAMAYMVGSINAMTLMKLEPEIAARVRQAMERLMAEAFPEHGSPEKVEQGYIEHIHYLMNVTRRHLRA